VWYLSVTLDQSHRAGRTIAADQVKQVRCWIENYHRVKQHLEKISNINRELLHRQKRRTLSRNRTRK
jgi:hypothetical protein